MPENLDHIAQTYIKADLLYSEQEVHHALDRLAYEITTDLQHENPLVISIMNGALVFSGHLLTRLNFPLQLDYLHATRYGNNTRGDELQWLAKPEQPVMGRTVLLLDDIYDEGITLDQVAQHCIAGGASKVISAVLLKKQHQRAISSEYEPKYCGLTVDDRYVFGFGMDYQGYWRNAPGIFALKEQ